MKHLTLISCTHTHTNPQPFCGRGSRQEQTTYFGYRVSSEISVIRRARQLTLVYICWEQVASKISHTTILHLQSASLLAPLMTCFTSNLFSVHFTQATTNLGCNHFSKALIFYVPDIFYFLITPIANLLSTPSRRRSVGAFSLTEAWAILTHVYLLTYLFLNSLFPITS